MREREGSEGEGGSEYGDNDDEVEAQTHRYCVVTVNTKG